MGAPVSLPGKGDDQVRVQLEFTSRDLDTDPPPARCHIRGYKTTRGWVLLLWAPDGPTDMILAWARAQTEGEEIDFGEIGERTVALRCEALPEKWRMLFGSFDADHLILDPDGGARTRIEGPRNHVGGFLTEAGLETDTTSVTIVDADDGERPDDLLTGRQNRALSRAAALGYFEIPRKIQLSELANQLDMSTSALSELLRRAQARLVTAYLENQLGGLEALVELEEPQA